MTGTFQLNLDENLLRRIESWRRQNPLVASIPDAVTMLARAGLKAQLESPLGAVEKLNLVLLAQLCRKAGIVDPVDPEFLQKAVQRGHFWAIEWQYPTLADPHSNNSAQADFVTRLMTIWRQLTESFENLAEKDRVKVRIATGVAGALEFPGFDHHRETNYSSIARFMVEELKLFPTMRDSAAMDSQRPMLPAYRTMITNYDTLRENAAERLLDADQLVDVMASLSQVSSD